MRLKLVLLFFLTILIPTLFLAYFSLLAIQGEKEIVETNLRQKYQSMAEIILQEIEDDLKAIPQRLRTDPNVIEPLLYQHTLLFEDEVMIFNREGKAVDGNRRRRDFETPAYLIKVPNLPYEIAVYERYHILSSQFAAMKKKIAQHVTTVSLCTLAIFLGGLFTLGELFHEWKKTEIKAEFMSHLVHDLRGPLTSIRMFSEMLEHDRVPGADKRKEYYRIISAESEKLIQLANNVLDLSHIENRGHPYPLEDNDLIKVVSETVMRFQSHMPNGTRRIITVLPSFLPKVRMHADSISQILMNLLSNAVKYSPPDSEIRVVLSQKGKSVMFSVIDLGLGIPKPEQKKIFQKYYRGQDKDVRNREGSGLGLSLVKYAVLAHRGKIILKSEEGKGSEFKIILPIT